MKMEVTEEKENPALKRKELKVSVDYEGGATPSSKSIGEGLAKQLDVGPKQVEVMQVIGDTGQPKGQAKVYVWESVQAREAVRGNLPEAKPNAEVPAEAAPEKKAEAPEEELKGQEQPEETKEKAEEQEEAQQPPAVQKEAVDKGVKKEGS